MDFFLPFTRAKYDQIPIGNAQKQIWTGSLNRASLCVYFTYQGQSVSEVGGALQNVPMNR